MPKVSSRKTRRRGSIPAARTCHSARAVAASGRPRSAAWIVFFEADLQVAEGVPQVGDRGPQVQVALEVFERGAGLGRDPRADALALALGQGAAFVGGGLRFQRSAGAVQRLEGADPSGAGAEHLGDLAAGVALVGQGDDAVAVFDGQSLHRGILLGFPDSSPQTNRAQDGN